MMPLLRMRGGIDSRTHACDPPAVAVCRAPQDALKRTRERKAALPEILLDNFKQTMSEDRRLTSPEDSECIFVQAYRQLGFKNPDGFRNVRTEPDRVFRVRRPHV